MGFAIQLHVTGRPVGRPYSFTRPDNWVSMRARLSRISPRTPSEDSEVATGAVAVDARPNSAIKPCLCQYVPRHLSHAPPL